MEKLTEKRLHKLMVSKLYIKQLKNEIGKLKFENGQLISEIQHLEHTIKIMEQKLNNFTGMTKKEKSVLRKDHLIKEYIQKINSLTEKNKRLKKINEDLIIKLNENEK